MSRRDLEKETLAELAKRGDWEVDEVQVNASCVVLTSYDGPVFCLTNIGGGAEDNRARVAAVVIAQVFGLTDEALRLNLIRKISYSPNAVVTREPGGIKVITEGVLPVQR